ncbi:hypothetical protein LCGC14_2659880 [marine sediment metagenome]|uniref:Uncharacterized protein n=1 Tax=marine sediment metagenome TaxID=412755 RepID=A0A0F8ZS87_9ZZZZ
MTTYKQPEHGWTCFHCGETFKKFGAAQDHFGDSIDGSAGCQIKAGEELGLLMALRKAEARIEELLLDVQMYDDH